MKNNKKIEILIDGKKIKAEERHTILEAAKEAGIDIPAPCFHSDLEIKSNCRLCIVELKGKKGFYTSCSTKAENGMEIITNSPKIKKARKINLELIFAQHCEECEDCVWNYKCQLLEIAKKYNIKIIRAIN